MTENFLLLIYMIKKKQESMHYSGDRKKAKKVRDIKCTFHLCRTGWIHFSLYAIERYYSSNKAGSYCVNKHNILMRLPVFFRFCILYIRHHSVLDECD